MNEKDRIAMEQFKKQYPKIKFDKDGNVPIPRSLQIGALEISIHILTRKPYIHLGIFRNKTIIWILNRLFYTVVKLPYRITGQMGTRIIAWIMQHTPADEDERK